MATHDLLCFIQIILIKIHTRFTLATLFLFYFHFAPCFYEHNAKRTNTYSTRLFGIFSPDTGLIRYFSCKTTCYLVSSGTKEIKLIFYRVDVSFGWYSTIHQTNGLLSSEIVNHTRRQAEGVLTACGGDCLLCFT